MLTSSASSSQQVWTTREMAPVVGRVFWKADSLATSLCVVDGENDSVAAMLSLTRKLKDVRSRY